ncbi:pentapeptide repeat-containing protein [Saccharopolyspora endophytica]|uniref:Pentapeptide repeat-containing protein n=1 Tax=Saccharopolyspora endophytica TaxID=543886 RepID=A0ABS5DHY4_9PSEU|nr:pentapeptide repeat-containing protein [Saccharopolyspora endophytica]MBQ0925900.1 pentapeptide repeat-containing protein [Saccharopolyspora endophytica]
MSRELLALILDAVGDDNGHPAFEGDVWFDGATFKDDARFSNATFGGETSFIGVTFERDALFDEATFVGDTWFSNSNFSNEASFELATFNAGAQFEETTFGREASFIGVNFGGQAWFSGAIFTGEARFEEVAFGGRAQFEHAAFADKAWFEEATFSAGAHFNDVAFSGKSWFYGAIFTGKVSFKRAAFEVTESFGLVVARVIDLSHVVFSRRVLLQVSAAKFNCNETRFEAGVVLQLHNAEATFRRAEFAAPSTIANASHPPAGWVRSVELEIVEWEVEIGQRTPALTSLEGADVTDLVVTDVDLSRCRFAGAHHLDTLRLEGDCKFALPPKGIQCGWRWPPVWRWTRRQVLTEECNRRAGLKNPEWTTASQSAVPPVQLNAKRVAAVYRDLRKAQEDSKNEPGAADFYYGEMEMRRTDRSTAWPERLILFLYWLVSGYGLRMTRALICLISLIAIAMVILYLVGFGGSPPGSRAVPPPNLGTCLLFVVESVVSLQPKLAGLPSLTWQGEVVRVAMRLLGPLLLGLAVLAIRNRVKR